MSVRLTKRCMDLLALLRAARWLTTQQVRRRFFPQATLDATRKRLRKLTKAGYLVMCQEHRMREALFSLGREGKRVLETNGAEEVVLERKVGRQIDHLAGINDIRIAAETTLPLSYFFACWELPAVGWRQPLIPDAVFSSGKHTFAVEFDRGGENMRFFLRTKVAAYLRGLEGFPLTAVLIITDRRARMDSLARAIRDERGRFLFTTIDLVRKHDLAAPIFYRGGHDKGVSLV